MANPEHLAILQDALAKKAIVLWNNWVEQRFRKGGNLTIDLAGADLSSCDLFGANLVLADLSGANFERARLHQVRFWGTNLRGANLSSVLNYLDFATPYTLHYEGGTSTMHGVIGGLENASLFGVLSWTEQKLEMSILLALILQAHKLER